MKTLCAATAIGILVLSGIASAAELPSYEVFGFPVTQHQISVTGSTANVREQSLSESLLVAGMPASPHQLSVLTHHHKAKGWAEAQLAA